jgi:hypothetical protein
MTKYESLIFSVSVIALIISTIVAFATIWYVRIAARTLKEIGLQRVNTYLPVIIIESLPFYTYTNTENNFPVEFTYSQHPARKDDFYYFQLDLLKLKCYNVGFGAAKNVVVSYDFNIQEAIDIIHKYSPNQKFQDKRIFTIKIIEDSLWIEHLDADVSMIKIYDPEKLSFILPMSISNTPTEVSLAGYISHLYAIYSFIRWQNIKNRADMGNFPTIKIKLSYQDINDKYYEMAYSIDLLWKGGRPEEGWNELVVSS